jgi:phosphoribosylformylglycinamidine synthase
MHQIAECIRGLGEGARALEVPVVSGNVSLYNETNGKGILPTPLLAVVGLIDDVTKATSATFKQNGDIILLIGKNDETNVGGSSYLAEIHKIEAGALPELNYEQERKSCDCVRALIDKRLLQSCHDLSQGGLGVTLAESCFREYQAPLGASIALTQQPRRKDAALFNESGARFLVSCTPTNLALVRDLITQHGLLISAEGVVGGDTITVKGVAELSLATAHKVWHTGLDAIFEA